MTIVIYCTCFVCISSTVSAKKSDISIALKVSYLLNREGTCNAGNIEFGKIRTSVRRCEESVLSVAEFSIVVAIQIVHFSLTGGPFSLNLHSPCAV